MLGGFWRSPGSHNCKIREQSEASTVVNSGVLGFWVSAHADASQTFSWSGARPIDFLQVDRCERHRTFAVILRAILDLLYWVVCSWQNARRNSQIHSPACDVFMPFWAVMMLLWECEACSWLSLLFWSFCLDSIGSCLLWLSLQTRMSNSTLSSSRFNVLTILKILLVWSWPRCIL